MSSVKDVFQEIDGRLKADPTKSKEIDGAFKFVVTGEGAGTYVVDTRAVEVRDGEGDGDVTITVEGPDLIAIKEGTLDAMQAFMLGKVAVDGDFGLAMKLQQILA